VVPGNGFGQKEGTYHIRLTSVPCPPLPLTHTYSLSSKTEFVCSATLTQFVSRHHMLLRLTRATNCLGCIPQVPARRGGAGARARPL
jgi:hypothetical protein